MQGYRRYSSSRAVSTYITSNEQVILKQILDVVGRPAESRLQLAPRWIIEKGIQKEKENYAESNAYGSISIRGIKRRSNIINSHHFFQIKQDGEEGKLKLKCRLVTHENRHAEKNNLPEILPPLNFKSSVYCSRWLQSSSSVSRLLTYQERMFKAAISSGTYTCVLEKVGLSTSMKSGNYSSPHTVFTNPVDYGNSVSRNGEAITDSRPFLESLSFSFSYAHLVASLSYWLK